MSVPDYDDLQKSAYRVNQMFLDREPTRVLLALVDLVWGADVPLDRAEKFLEEYGNAGIAAAHWAAMLKAQSGPTFEEQVEQLARLCR